MNVRTFNLLSICHVLTPLWKSVECVGMSTLLSAVWVEGGVDICQVIKGDDGLAVG